MATSGKGTGIVGYPMCRSAVDAQHHLIIAHEVTNVGNDRGQLASMAQQALTAMGRKDLEIIGGPKLWRRAKRSWLAIRRV